MTTYLLILGARNNSASRVFTKKDIADLKHCIKTVFVHDSGFTIVKGLGGWLTKSGIVEEHSRLVLITADDDKKTKALMNLLVATFQQSPIMLVKIGDAHFHSGSTILAGMTAAKPRHEKYDEVDV